MTPYILDINHNGMYYLSNLYHYKFNNNLSIMLRSSYAKRYFDTKYFYTTSAYDQSNELIEKSWIQTRVNYMINKTSSIQLNSAYQSVNDIYVFNPDFPIYENTTNLLNSIISPAVSKGLLSIFKVTLNNFNQPFKPGTNG